jgi:hypothetical protein
VPFVPIVTGLIAIGLIVLALVGLRVVRSLRRFDQARGLSDRYLADHTGLLKARSAALGVALSDLGPLRTPDRSELGIGRQ